MIRSVSKASILAVICVLSWSLPAALAEVSDTASNRPKEVSANTLSSVAAEGFNINDKAAVPSGVNIRSSLELEIAIQEYLMTFDAYREARQSTAPEARAKLPKLLKAYREAYAKAIKMMRDDKLIHPMIPQNPLKVYKEEYKAKHGEYPPLDKRDYKELRKAIKNAIKEGKSTDEILIMIRNRVANLSRPAPAPTPIPLPGGAGGSSGDNAGTDDGDKDSRLVPKTFPQPDQSSSGIDNEHSGGRR